MELNRDGLCPLHVACAAGCVEVVKQILKARKDVCVLKSKDGKTPLHFAAIKGRVDVVKELISACPHCVKMINVCGETALHVAVKSTNFETVKILMEELKRLDAMEIVNWKDKDGDTILHLASIRRQQEMMELIIGKNGIGYGVVEVNPINSSGLTPMDALDSVLQSGPECNDFRIVEMFQQARAMKAKEIVESLVSNHSTQANDISNSNQNETIPVVSRSLMWNIWGELKKEINGSSKATQDALMVVAVPIATVTYQAILSPPSGFWSAETRRAYQTPINNGIDRGKGFPGEAVMAQDPRFFTIFTVYNSVGFFASLAMISILTSGFPLRAGLRLAISSMAATYAIAVVYMSPIEMKVVAIVVGLVYLLVIFHFGRFMLWLLKKWGILPRSRLIARRSLAAVRCGWF